MRLAALVLFAAALTACAPRPAAPAPPHVSDAAAGPTSDLPPPGVVSGSSARQLVAQGARLVDVRTPEEFAAGHVPGALNIPFDEIGRRAAEVGDPGEPVVLYCRTGRRSGIAAETLRGLGFRRTYDLRRYTDWPSAQ